MRPALVADGIDLFVVPRAARYPGWMGDMYEAREEALAALTGYTGYTGVLMIARNAAIMRVDALHLGQARQQCGPAGPELVAFEEGWSAAFARAAPISVIGADPARHDAGDWQALEAAALACGARVKPVALDSALVFAWPDRPPAGIGTSFCVPLAASGWSIEDKLQTVAGLVRAKGVDALFVVWPDAVSWLCNVRSDLVPCTPLFPGSALILADGSATLFTDQPLPADFDLPSCLRIEPVAGCERALAKGKGRRLWVAPETRMADINRAQQGGWHVEVAPDPVLDLMEIKHPAEQAASRAAHLADGLAMARLLAFIDAEMAAGTPPDELAIGEAALQFRRLQPGFLDLSFPTIAASGPNAASPHYVASVASNRRLRRDDVLMLDSGAQYRFGTTDVTRTMLFGAVDPAWRRWHTLVAKAMIRLSLARFPVGTRGDQLDMAARQTLWNAYQDYPHNTGHGVGACLSAGEGAPRIGPGPRGRHVIRPGMILSNEPAIYIADTGGWRTENLLLSVEDRPGWLAFETLTLVPIDPSMLDLSLFDPAERQWLDSYNTRVHAILAPHLDAETVAWLRRVCGQPV